MRNVLNCLHETAYLTICMTVFPYVYPQLNSEKYDFYPIVVITLFALVYAILMLVLLGYFVCKPVKREHDFPIAREAPEVDHNANQDVLEKWLEGKEFVKVEPKPKEPEKVEPEPVKEPPPVIEETKSKPSSQTDQTESEESDETEESEESESEESNHAGTFIQTFRFLLGL